MRPPVSCARLALMLTSLTGEIELLQGLNILPTMGICHYCSTKSRPTQGFEANVYRVYIYRYMKHCQVDVQVKYFWTSFLNY